MSKNINKANEEKLKIYLKKQEKKNGIIIQSDSKKVGKFGVKP
jgi:hypothetical protein